MKTISVVGARPQFIKVKPIIDEFGKKKTKHILVHTGQHYDYEMSKIFFDELNIPEPDYNLEVGSYTHGKQTALMLERIEKVLLKEKPDIVIVYGDTNSTLAGALAAVKLHIPVAHVEAGLRSYRSDMPEEVNRLLTDHVSMFLFCPTKAAVKNLRKEGITNEGHLVGDVMYDTFLGSQELLSKREIISKLGLKPKEYFLLTIHRQENTDNQENLKSILSASVETKERIVFPVHPRTKKAIEKLELGYVENLVFTKPVSYLDMLALEKNAKGILTDSGGVQKEAYWFRVPCITLRDETEWVELIDSGVNVLAGVSRKNILNEIHRMLEAKLVFKDCLYGNGNAGNLIVQEILR